MELYKPVVSTAKDKKYMLFVSKNGKKRLIHFGDSRYGQFHDRIGFYGHLDHNDDNRKQRYYARHGESINSAKFWSNKILYMRNDEEIKLARRC